MELDLGINVRIIDGEVSILSPADNTTVPPTPLVSGEQSFTLPIPMVYGRARFDLPMTNFYGVGEMNFIGYSGNKLTDIKIGAGYESDLGFGAEVGFRSMRLTIDDVDDVDADVDIKGIYAGVTFSF
jgi:outer membrane protein